MRVPIDGELVGVVDHPRGHNWSKLVAHEKGVRLLGREPSWKGLKDGELRVPGRVRDLGLADSCDRHRLDEVESRETP
jgi:hypothetical protein